MFEFEEFTEFVNNFESNQQKIESFMIGLTEVAGGVMLREMQRATPEGEYDDRVWFVRDGKLQYFHNPSGATRVGGTLRKAWRRTSAKVLGDTYQVDAMNNTPYASWVNEGHMNADHTRYIAGQFYVEEGIDRTFDAIDPIIRSRFVSFLESLGG